LVVKPRKKSGVVLLAYAKNRNIFELNVLGDELIELLDIGKIYGEGDSATPVLKGISFRIEKGDYVSVMGASGTGKTTLMNILGLLDKPTSGHYRLDGNDVVNLDDRGILLRNNKGNENNWLQVLLIGTTSNRDGVGARVQLTVGGKVQTTQKKSASGYLSQNDPRLHFGLSTSKIAEKLEITWPSGKIQILENLEAGQVVTVTEP